MTSKKAKLWKTILFVVAALSFWTFIVCYPNPYILIRNTIRYFRLPIDPSVIYLIDVPVPNEPVEIEKTVLQLIKYEYDWKNYGVPDYVATARQAVVRRSGDCEDRAAVLASLLEAKNIPYSLKASLTHFWVDYPGKRQTRSENDGVSYFGKVDGKYMLKLPAVSQWLRFLSIQKKGMLDVMPTSRKVIMISGWVIIILLGYLMNRKLVLHQIKS